MIDLAWGMIILGSIALIALLYRVYWGLSMRGGLGRLRRDLGINDQVRVESHFMPIHGLLNVSLDCDSILSVDLMRVTWPRAQLLRLGVLRGERVTLKDGSTVISLSHRTPPIEQLPIKDHLSDLSWNRIVLSPEGLFISIVAPEDILRNHKKVDHLASSLRSFAAAVAHHREAE